MTRQAAAESCNSSQLVDDGGLITVCHDVACTSSALEPLIFIPESTRVFQLINVAFPFKPAFETFCAGHNSSGPRENHHPGQSKETVRRGPAVRD